MQSFIELALMVPEIIRGIPGPLNGVNKPGLNNVKRLRNYLGQCLLLASTINKA